MATSEYEVDEQSGGNKGESFSWTTVLAGAAIGLVVGGSLALLFAPKPGSDLREDLGDAIEDIRDRAENLIDSLQSTTQELVDRSRSALDQTRDNVLRSVEAGREAYVQKRDELSAQFDS